MATTGFAPASGAELAWTAEGDGTPVLLVHAGVADQRMWEPVSARLRGGHMVVRYDMRGFGMSRFHSGAFSPAADAVAVLDALERSSAHVAGCSYGALIALELAVSHPERVSSLTLFAPPQPDLDWSDDIEAFGNAEDAALSAGRPEEAVELNLSMWVDRPGSASSSRGLRSLVADMQRRAFDLQTATPIEPEDTPAHSLAGLQAVSCPTRIVIGALDHPDFQRSADNLAGAIPRARVQRVSDVGHLLPLENDAVAADAIATTIREATELRPGDDRRDSASP